MSTTCRELFRSRSGDVGSSGRRELLYSITGSDDDAAVITAIQAAAPATFGGLTRDTITIDQVGPKTWMAKVGYTTSSYAIGVTEHKFAFQIGGGTQHVTQSIATIYKAGAGGAPAPNFKGALNVEIKNGQTNVRGVDIAAPKGEFSELHCLANATVTAAYQRGLMRLCGKYNVAAFRGYAIGEVQFIGAEGDKGDDGYWRITFKFQVSENRSSVKFNAGDADEINLGAVQGWDYIWCLYEESADDAANCMISKPTAAYREKVLHAGAFSALGIGEAEL